MKLTGDQNFIKKMNKSLVLELIRKKAPLSRAQVSLSTGLNKGTVSTIVAELISEDLVYEIGPGQSSGGRRPVLLMFKNTAGYSIGVDIGVNYLLGVLTDLSGNVIESIELVSPDTEEASYLKTLEALIKDLIKRTPSSTYGVVGIGIAVPGIVNSSGKVLFAPNLNWKDIDLRSHFEDIFNLPVKIENEANSGAYGERIFGKGTKNQNMLYVSVGIGIGSGIIINDQIFKGPQGYSGEVGHISIESSGLKCTCGNRGCWELYASEQALIRKANKIFKSNKSFNELIDLASAHHTQTISIFNEIGDYLGQGITNLVNIFNPELVIIGNRITKAQKWIEPSLKQTVKSRAISYHQENLSIEFSDLNSTGIALGASFLIIEHFIKNTV